MRFGAFPSSDVFKIDGGSSVQQVSVRMKPGSTKPSPRTQLVLGRRADGDDAIESQSRPAKRSLKAMGELHLHERHRELRASR